jgi:hypothetical protein
MKQITDLLLYTTLGTVLILFIFGMWTVGKKFNYKYSYESMVEQTVKHMVKSEYLE